MKPVHIYSESLRAVATADEFMAKLPSFDDHFKSLNDAARERGQVLRYVGVVDTRGVSSVKLVGWVLLGFSPRYKYLTSNITRIFCRYPASHPFASLTGSDNIIAFTTKRFYSPLIVQGAGAGAAVTAFGMFSDVLKIASRVLY